MDKSEYNKQSRKQYRKEHKDQIREYNKNYNQEHKDQIIQYSKQYRKEHKDQIQAQRRVYREQNREKLYEKSHEPFHCDCGVTVTKSSKCHHIKSDIHNELLKNPHLIASVKKFHKNNDGRCICLYCLNFQVYCLSRQMLI